ncbi:MAG: type II toxin-antitoxin system VapB family antitoxin [Sphingomonas sp.]
MMRTNIEIDDALMAQAMQASGARTKREAVEIALRGLVQLGRQKEILKLRGKINWVGDLDAMRRDD